MLLCSLCHDDGSNERCFRHRRGSPTAFWRDRLWLLLTLERAESIATPFQRTSFPYHTSRSARRTRRSVSQSDKQSPPSVASHLTLPSNLSIAVYHIQYSLSTDVGTLLGRLDQTEARKSDGHHSQVIESLDKMHSILYTVDRVVGSEQGRDETNEGSPYGTRTKRHPTQTGRGAELEQVH